MVTPPKDDVLFLQEMTRSYVESYDPSEDRCLKVPL